MGEGTALAVSRDGDLGTEEPARCGVWVLNRDQDTKSLKGKLCRAEEPSTAAHPSIGLSRAVS